MRIEFNIFESNKSWTARTHQINSDILLKNVLVKGQMTDFNVSFTYDEAQHCGQIINGQQQVIGSFEVSC